MKFEVGDVVVQDPETGEYRKAEIGDAWSDRLAVWDGEKYITSGYVGMTLSGADAYGDPVEEVIAVPLDGRRATSRRITVHELERITIQDDQYVMCASSRQYYCSKCKEQIDSDRVKFEARGNVMKAICPQCGRIVGSEAKGTNCRWGLK
jgi:hypothetical protein